MNLIDGQLNLGLNFDLDIEAQNEAEAHDRQKVYKLKMAKKFEYIIFGIYILQYANFLLLWLFPLFYSVCLLVLQFINIS